MANNFKIANAVKLNAELTNIANSIRTKTNTSGTLNFYNGDFRVKVDSILTPTDGSIPTVLHTKPTVTGVFNTTSGNVEMNASHTQGAGYVATGNTLYGTGNVSVGIGTITASGSKTQSTPTFTFNASNGVVTANVAATSGTITPSVSTAGYVSGTVGTKTAGSFTMGTSQATYNVGLASINTPGGSATQSKPGMTFDAANGIVTASVAATSGTAYANVTTAGYTASGTKSGTFTMNASSNTYNVGVATNSTSSVTNSANSVTGWVNVTAGYTPGFNQKVTGNVPASTFDNANKISGTSFLETTGDYGFRASVDLPAGYYAGGTYTKEFKTGIFPAPESKGTADKMLTGYSLYDQDGKLITGTMPNQGAQNSTLTYASNSYTIPAGYHNGAGIINVPKATRATPSINSVTFNASNNIISIDANVVQTAGVVDSGTKNTTTTKNVYDLVGTGASTISGTIYTGKPGLSVANSTGIVTASVASANTSLTPSVTAGYITSGTAGNVTAESNSNTLQLNTKAGGTTTITSNTKIINAGQFATGDIYATVTAGVINTPSGSATQSTPTFSFNASNGVVTASVAATSGTAYRNVTTAGYLPTSTTGGTFTMNASSNTYNIGLAAINTPSGVGSASITAGTFAYNATAGNYGLTGSGTISGDAYRNVTSAGYIGTSSTKGSVTGTASLGMNVAKTTATTTISGTVARTPVIGVQAVPSGVTNAASGAATTTAPSSGVYVAVKSPANTTTATAAISSVSAGYSDGTNYGKSEGNATAGASASSVTYIPVTSGTIGAPTGSANQSKPSFSFDATNGIVTASVAATSGTAYRNVTKAGWLPTSTTGGTFTMNASSNTYNVGIASINAPSGSAAQSTPSFSFDATNGIVTASVAATSGMAYANITSAGYTGTATKSGTFSMTASSNTYNVGLSTKSVTAGSASGATVSGWVNVTAGYTPAFNQQITASVATATHPSPVNNAMTFSGSTLTYNISHTQPAGYNEGHTSWLNGTMTINLDVWSEGASAPSNQKLFWIDTNATTGGLKYYNGSAWVAVPVAWS